jgi:hypothetical protein
MRASTVKHIPLDTIRDRLKYDPETGAFTRIRKMNNRTKVGEVAGSISAGGRVVLEIDGSQFYAHRVAWELHYGPVPYGMMLDHIDGNPLNNRLDNLRVCSRTTNAQNQRRAHSRNTTGVLGVSRAISHGRWRGKFYAHIRVEGKLIHLGTFDTRELAGEAYIKAKRQYHEGCTL